MKKIFILMVVLIMAACGRKEDGRITLNLKGELPATGEVRVEVYGYDKMLADHRATLIVIHREELNQDREVIVELPENAQELIDPPVRDKDGASYYANIRITDEDTTYTQDYDKNPFIEVEKGSVIDIQMKKE
ncbi:hypothetical protein PM10SUCC1_27560 [Propionigenium maris DSM 9537]|uniref:Lipoprotein n=1 Tax=Propionigenium maris DSM 9537 TaxID=1123000 RepID=A0A9W6LP56_9FUSO|nr:hypothetical protein [Propionigenium maris]GLI57242.1 hypothetical protein PM10SUCC1_27560 [Propionigenium maris DSM 9537]